MIDAIIHEIGLQKDYFGKEQINTIYFGGGTPSLLNQEEIKKILYHLYNNFNINHNIEITLEANPDDLNSSTLKELKTAKINRLSIGIQSFFDLDLQFMNRAHNAQEADTCIKNAQDIGFENLSIDLIYGSPTTTDEMWAKNLEKVISLNIPHISSYCMTVEENTALYHFVKKGKTQAIDDEKAAKQFLYLMNKTQEANYEHYEISNFAKNQEYSQHNTSYWQGKKYLGIGPSAHSFDGKNRHWNIAHNQKYMDNILNKNSIPFETEELTAIDLYNEYIMISLRTMWGCDFSKINDIFKNYFNQRINQYLKNGKAIEKNGHFILTNEGKLLADQIASDLFYVE